MGPEVHQKPGSESLGKISRGGGIAKMLVRLILILLVLVEAAQGRPSLHVEETLLVTLDPPPAQASGTQADYWPFGYSLWWTPNFERVGYWAYDQTGMFLIMDGVRGRTFPSRDDGSPRGTFSPPDFEFGPNGEHFWYEAEHDGKVVVVVDDKESRLFDRIRDFQFSPDSHHYAFVGERAGQHLVVRDGKEGKAYSWIAAGDLHFSQDSQRMAYWARSRGRDLIVLQEGEKVSETGFQPDGRSKPLPIDPPWPRSNGRAKTIERDGKKILIVDGLESRPYDYLDKGYLTFSPDGKHFAYYGVADQKTFLVVDGEEVGPYEDSTGIVLPRIRWDQSDSLRTLTLRDGRLYRVKVDIGEE